jgi:hypothetical protein
MIMEHGDGAGDGMDHGGHGHLGHDMPMPMPMPGDGPQCSVSLFYLDDIEKAEGACADALT